MSDRSKPNCVGRDRKSEHRPAATRSSRTAPQPDALAFRIDEVAQMGGPGRTKVYELAAQGKLRLIRVGGRTLVVGDSLRTLLSEGSE
jgi:excisionase family DNA binding protein